MYNNKPKRKPIYDETLGEPPTEDQIERMKKQANNVVTYWMDQSEKTRHELFTKIKNKGITDDVANEILAKYEELGYIDDKKFAENFIYSKQKYEKLGKRSIGYKLKFKGVAQEIIDEALLDVDEEEEEDNARLLLERKMRSTKKLEPHKRITNLASMLARKGYSSSVAFKLAKEAVEAERLEEENEEE
jgi:regulatory protein